jgi:hypothetical protein
MPEDRNDPLADIFTLLVAPLSGTVRSVEQFRKGVDEFLKGVENFNRAMANLNESTERVNSLLADVEEPIRAAIPQVTRTVRAADEMMQVVSGPAMAVAPGLSRLADTLSTPAFAQLPGQISMFSDVLGEVSHRLSPLTQMAEAAGGLLGGLRVPGIRQSATPPRSGVPSPAVVPPEPAVTAATPTTVTSTANSTSPAKKTSPAKRTTTTSTAKKSSAAKKSAAKKSAAKKSAAKKSAAKKSAAKKRTVKTATTTSAKRSAASQ